MLMLPTSLYLALSLTWSYNFFVQRSLDLIQLMDFLTQL